MPINFPDSPTNGQQFSVGDTVWEWNSASNTWDIVIETLVGPTGPTGLTGAVGPTGPTGAGFDAITATTSDTSVTVGETVSLSLNKVGALVAGSPIRVILANATDYFEATIQSFNDTTASVSVSYISVDPLDASAQTLTVALVGERGAVGATGDTGPTGADAPDITSVSSQVLPGTSPGNSYTLVLSDKTKLIEMANPSDTVDSTLFIPSDSVADFEIGTTVTIARTDLGEVLISGDGVDVDLVLNYTPSNKLRARWSSATLVKRAANKWLLIGDLL
jgi:hypothetical protein